MDGIAAGVTIVAAAEIADADALTVAAVVAAITTDTAADTIEDITVDTRRSGVLS